jgi:hypothetical protein
LLDHVQVEGTHHQEKPLEKISCVAPFGVLSQPQMGQNYGLIAAYSVIWGISTKLQAQLQHRGD